MRDEDGHGGRPQLRPQLNHFRAARLRKRLQLATLPDEVSQLRRWNEDQALTIITLQKAMNEVRQEMADMKRAHLKELMRYDKR